MRGWIVAIVIVLLASCERGDGGRSAPARGFEAAMKQTAESFFEAVVRGQFDAAFEHVAYRAGTPDEAPGIEYAKAKRLWTERIGKLHGEGTRLLAYEQVAIQSEREIPQGAVKLRWTEREGAERTEEASIHFHQTDKGWKVLKVFPKDQTKQSELELAMGGHVGVKAAVAVKPSATETRPPILEADAKPASFRSGILQLSFGQNNKSQGYVFRTLEGTDLLDRPYAVARHMDEFSIGWMWSDDGKRRREELLKQIKVEGKASLRIQSDNELGASLNFSEMGDTFTVKLGDLQAITVTRMEPLGIRLEAANRVAPILLLQGDSPYTPRLAALLPSREKQLIVAFSEDMDMSQFRQLPAGTWLDARRYRLELRLDQAGVSDSVMIGVSLMPFRSARGNFVEHGDWSTNIHWKLPDRWRDIATGETVGWSERDPFYDAIEFSPDRSKYVGAAMAGYPDGDGDGRYYGLVLEEKGKPPKVIEPIFYTAVLQDGSPVQWLDNDRLLYADPEQIFEYSIGSGRKRAVFTMKKGEHCVHAFAYDRYSDKLYVLTHRYESKDGKEQLSVNAYVLDRDYQQLERIERWTVTPFEYSYRPKRLPIRVTEQGVYRTFVRDGRVFTQFEARVGGKKAEASGETVYADGKLALLLEDAIPEKPGGEMPQIVRVWRMGSEPVEAAKTPGLIRVYGNRMIAEKDGKRYVYDIQSDSWESWQDGGGLLHLSPSGMYKKTKK